MENPWWTLDGLGQLGFALEIEPSENKGTFLITKEIEIEM